ETVDRAALGALGPGDPVNLERAMRADARFGGHIVQGHVDGTGIVLDRTEHEKWHVVRISLPDDLGRYVVEKGSITVSGTSLTVSAVSPVDHPEPWFEVSLIPTTLDATTLGGLTPGDPVNLEVDVLAKYVERLIDGRGDRPACPDAPYLGGVPAADARARRDRGEPRAVTTFDGIDRAIADIAAGRAVVVVDSEDRENEGDLIFAAELATPELMAFLVRYSSGYVCVSLEAEDCVRLDLPPMRAINEDRHDTAYAVTVDARTGVTTGISAADRARTAQLLASPGTAPGDLTRPGHMVPLRARPGGVLTRPGHTEAAVDLARLAGLRAAGVICEIVSEDDPTTMARSPELRRFADRHGLAMVTIEALQAWRRAHEVQVVHEVAARIPTPAGTLTAHGYRDVLQEVEH